MNYNKSALKGNDDMKCLLDKFNFDLDKLVFNAYYHPDEQIYQSTLTIELEDDNESEVVRLVKYELSTMIENLGNKSIGRDFSSEFIGLLNEHINDKSAR